MARPPDLPLVLVGRRLSSELPVSRHCATRSARPAVAAADSEMPLGAALGSLARWLLGLRARPALRLPAAADAPCYDKA